MNFVSYDVTDPEHDLPFVRVKIHGMGGGQLRIADGAVPWHASARMRQIATELNALADQFDRDYPPSGHLVNRTAVP